MNYNIENWFPKPIYYTDNVCVDHLPTFEQTIKNVINTNGAVRSDLLGVNSTHTTSNDLFKINELLPLTNAILDHIMIFARHLGYDPITICSMKFQQMWANISDQHGYNFSHIHAGAVFSGAYYIKTVPENKITFFNNNDAIMPPMADTEYSKNYVNYQCVPGRLLLFKSDFAHGNTPQREPGEKIVISFNVGFL